MMKCTAALATLGFTLLGGLTSPLRADAPIFGGQFTLSQAESNLGGTSRYFSSRIGAGGGLHCLIDLGGGHALRPRGDVAFFRSGPVKVMASDSSVELYREDAKSRILSLGVDYNYFTTYSHEEGGYFLLGVGRSKLQCTGAVLTSVGMGTPPVPLPSTQSATATSFSVGFGWRLTPHLGSEFRFSQAAFKNVGTDSSMVRAPTLNLSLTMEF